ncbi:S-adenosyl-L-methionine-dependent methyltransferase, partial [Crucibulum laeve]
PIQHKARIYTPFPGSAYVLPSDDLERERLELQHHLLERIFDGKLLHAPVALDGELEVLETGTGTGIWLLQLASQVSPSVSLTGLDIENRLFPINPPNNITLSTGSVTSMPLEWSNRFTLVHQRLLRPALRRSDWPIALKEIYRVVAPGGWVQLCEVGERTSGPATAKHSKYTDMLYDFRGLFTHCSHHMSRMLTEAGFVNVYSDQRVSRLGKWAGQDGIDGRDNAIGVWKGQKTPFLNAGGFGYVQSEEEFDQRLQEVEQEWDDTPGSTLKFFMFYAQK